MKEACRQHLRFVQLRIARRAAPRPTLFGGAPVADARVAHAAGAYADGTDGSRIASASAAQHMPRPDALRSHACAALAIALARAVFLAEPLGGASVAALAEHDNAEHLFVTSVATHRIVAFARSDASRTGRQRAHAVGMRRQRGAFFPPPLVGDM